MTTEQKCQDFCPPSFLLRREDLPHTNCWLSNWKFPLCFERIRGPWSWECLGTTCCENCSWGEPWRTGRIWVGQGVGIWELKQHQRRIPGVPSGLGVKDAVLSLLWHRFDPWPQNFSMIWGQPKGKIKIKARSQKRVVQSDKTNLAASHLSAQRRETCPPKKPLNIK